MCTMGKRALKVHTIMGNITDGYGVQMNLMNKI